MMNQGLDESSRKLIVKKKKKIVGLNYPFGFGLLSATCKTVSVKKDMV